MRAGLEAMLARDGGVAVVGAVAPGSALADEIEAREPEVVVADAGDGAAPPPETLMPEPLSHDAAARAPAFVLLTDVADPAWLADALHAGARGVLPRSAPAAEIVAAVEAAGAGLTVLPSGAAGALLSAIPRGAPRRPAVAPAQPLTPREVEILGMLAEGMGNKIIAARLRISEHTVKSHVASIFTRLRVETRAEAVAVGARLGLIML